MIFIQVVAHLNNGSLTAKILQLSLGRVNVASLTDNFAHEHGLTDTIHNHDSECLVGAQLDTHNCL